MGTEYTFYDYIDENGNNVIKNWLNNEAKYAKAFFNEIIGHLKTSSPPGGEGTFWKKPYAIPMKKNWKGFWELRKQAKNVQYRLLCKIANRNVYLVAFGTHKDQYYKTDVAPEVAEVRVEQMIDNPSRYRREHEYN